MTLLQPAHAEQILHADQEAADIGVFGSPRQAGAMIDRHERDLAAFTLHQRDQEAVQMIEIGQIQEG